MQTQTVFLFQTNSATQTGASYKSPIGSDNVVSICDAPSFSRGQEPETAEPTRDGLNCARGIRAAFVLEGGLGLLLYAIWHFRHVWHLVH